MPATAADPSRGGCGPVSCRYGSTCGLGAVPITLRLQVARARGWQSANRPGCSRYAARMRVGLISDTHGLLRPEALKALAGVEEILHAGDIGTPEVLEALRAVAPVQAVRGNNDRGAWASRLPDSLDLQLGGVRIRVLHDAKELDVDPDAGIDVVVSGHSHKPSVVRREGVLFVNPGSAGPRRFKLPVTVGYLTITRGAADAEIREVL